MKTKPHIPLRTRLVALAALLALPLHSPAADFTWNGGGGDGNFSTGLNWVGGSPAVSDLINTNLIFGGTLQLGPIVDSAFSANGLTFDSTAGAFSFTGSTLSLGASGIVNNSTNTMTFGNAVNFGGVFSSTINAASGGLTFNNTVTMPFTTLTVMGAGTTMLSGASASLAVGASQTLQLNSGLTVDAGAQLTRASGGTVTLAAGKTLTLQNGGDATFTGGYTATTASTITVTGTGSTLNTTTASLNVYAGSTFNILSGANVTISGGNLNLADTVGGGTLLVDGAGSAATATTGGLFVGFSGNAGNATFSNQASGSFNAIGVSDSVAAGSSGILNIQSGATITGTKLDMSPNAVINNGTLTISGTGSSLTLNGSSASAIGAASASTATLNIQTGGTFTTNSGTTTVNATGTTNLSGGALNVRGTFDNNGTFSFTGGTLDVKTGGNFQSGSSTFTVPTGATVSLTGGNFTGEGNVTIDGGQFTRVGGNLPMNAGGTFTVQNGGHANLTGGHLVNTASTILVTGSGSSFTTTSDLQLLGGSNLQVANTGSVSSGGGSFNLGSSGTGSTATFSNGGTGSFGGIRVDDGFTPGASSTLSIQSGSTVAGTSLRIAPNASANTGLVTISGTGSALTLSGSGASTIGAASTSTGALNIQSGGTFSTNTGTTTVNATGTVNLAGGTMNVNGTFDNNGSFSFSGGTLDVKTGGNFQSGTSTITVPTGATLAINGGTYTSEGDLTIDGGQMNRNSGNFTLAAGKALTVQNGGDAELGPNFFQSNPSTLLVTGSGSTLTGSGVLILTGGNVSTVLAGGSLSMGTGELRIAGAFGAGTLIVDGVNSTVSSPLLRVGTTGNTGSLIIRNAASAAFGEIDVDVTDFAGSNGTLSVESGAIVTGSSLQIAVPFTTVAANTGSVTITDAGSVLTLTGTDTSNIGHATTTTGTLNIQNSGTFTTNTGTLNLNATGTINLSGGTFNQNGTLNRAAGAFNFTSGTYNANVGFVTGSGGALGSNVTLGSGQTLNTAGTATIDAGSTLAVSGGAYNAQGDLTVNGTLTRDAASTFSLAAGKTMTVQGGGSAAFTGALNHNTTSTMTVTGAGSSLSATGSLSLASGSTTNVLSGGSLSSGSAATLSTGATLNVNGGTATFTGGLTSTGALNVSGTSDLFGAVSQSGSAATSIAAGGTANFRNSVTHSGGTFSVDTGGSAVFHGAVSGPGNFSGAGTVDFRGGYSPGSSPGIVTIAGDAIFAPTNTLTMEIGGLTPGTQHDQIQVGGNTTLSGAVNLAFTSNTFFPQSGNSFVIMDTAGTFANTATFTPSGLRSGWQFSTSYNAGTGELTVNSLSKGIPLTAPTANATWNNTSGNWTDAARWSTNPNVPLNGNGGFVYNVTQNGGTLTVNQAIDIDGFTKAGGTTTLSGANTLSSSAIASFNAGTINGTGVYNANGGLNLGTANDKTFSGGAQVVVGGTSTWSGGVMLLRDSSSFRVTQGSTFETTFDGRAVKELTNDGQSGTSTFTNEGTFIKSGTGGVGGVGVTLFDFVYNNSAAPVAFNNTATGQVQVNAGTLELQGGGTGAGQFSMASGATLTFGPGTAYTLNGATLNGPGRTTVTGAVSVAGVVNSSSPMTLNGTLFGSGTLNESAKITFQTGTIAGPVVVNANGGIDLTGSTGNMTINGSAQVIAGNNSTSTWTGGVLLMRDNSTFTVPQGSTFETNFDGRAVKELTNDGQSGASTFINEGTFIKSGTTGGSTVFDFVNNNSAASVAFNNATSGQVQVNVGTLELQGGGTSTGLFTVAAGATLSFGGTESGNGGRVYNLNSPSVTTSAGTVGFLGGTTNFNIGATYTNSGTTLVNGGTVNFNSGATSNTALLNITGGALAGNGTLGVSGKSTMTGGTIGGSVIVNAGGGFDMTGTGNKTINGSAQVIAGGNSTSTWTGGVLLLRDSSTFKVTQGSTFETTFDGRAVKELTNDGQSGASTFINEGTFIKSGVGGVGGVGVTLFDFVNNNSAASVAFNNTATGQVQVNAGTLELQGGGTGAGSFTMASGANLTFGPGQTYTLNGATLIGPGSTTVTGAVNVAGVVNSSSPMTLNGALFGGGTFNNSAKITFQTGTIAGPVVVNANGGIDMITSSNKTINGSAQVIARGTSTWTGGTVLLRDSAIFKVAAGATFETNFDGTFIKELANEGQSGASTFINEGTFIKSGGTGTTLFAFVNNNSPASVTFNNTGTVQVNSGTLTLSGGVPQHSGTTLTAGTWNVTNGASINITTGSNITTIGSSGSVTLDGAGSSFAKVTTALNNNQGSFTLKNNRDLTTAGAYTNSGTTRVEDSTTVMTIGTGGASAYTQSGPSSVTILSGGAMIDTSAFNLNGGALRGTGTIDAPLTATSGNATTIAPGASPGTITINGSTMLGSSNTLAMEVGGLASGIDYDLLVVNGILTLGGLLDVDFINGFENSVQFTDMFTIVTSNSPILGAFSNVASGSLLATNTTWNFRVWYGAGSPYGADKVVLVSPEPSRVIFLMLGLCGVVMRRRRQAGGSM